MGMWAPEATAALTANGGADGFATIGSNALFKVGATVWLKSDTQPSVECRVESLSGSDKVGLQIKRFQPGFPDKEIARYGRDSLAAYLLADNARISQEAGVVPRDPTLP